MRRYRRKVRRRATRRLLFETVEARRLLAFDGPTLYVDIDDPTPDTTGCGTLANPCNLIQTAIDRAVDGSVIQISAGTYPESLVLSKSLLLSGAGGVGGAVDVTIAPLNGPGLDAALADCVGVESLRFVNSANDDQGGLVISGVGTVILTNVETTGTGVEGLLLDGADKVTITGGSYSATLGGSGASGLDIFDVLALEMFNVAAVGNDLAGAVIESVTDLTISGGSFNDNLGGNGLELFDIDSMKLDGNLAADNNAGRGLSLTDVGDVDLAGGSYSGNAAEGIAISNAFNVTVRPFLTGALSASGNAGDGLAVVDAENINISRSSFGENGGHGINLDTVLDVTLTNVTANGNDPGVSVVGALSFTDTDGVYSNNADGGIVLLGIVGPVALTGTEANNNDSDNDGSGHGLEAAEIDSLTLTDVTMRDTDNAGPAFAQASGAVASTVTFGVLVTGGQFSGNQQDGLVLDGIGQGVVIDSGTLAEANQRHGIVVSNTAQAVEINETEANDNAEAGIFVTDIPDTVVLFNVQAKENGRGLYVARVNVFGDIQGVISGNTGEGAVFEDIVTDLTLAETLIDLNGGDGVQTVKVAQPASVGGNLLLSGVRIADCGGNGIRVDSVAGTTTVESGISGTMSTFSRNGQNGIDLSAGTQVTLNSVTATQNVGVGINLTDLSTGVTLDQVDSLNNEDDGLRVLNGTQVSLDGGSYTGNLGSGIDLESSGEARFTGVIANGNEVDGIAIRRGGSATFTQGDVSFNSGAGIRNENSAAVSLDGTVADFNDSGVNLFNVGTVTLTDVTANSNTGDGILLDTVDTVTITDQTAAENGFNGLTVTGTSVPLEITRGQFRRNGSSGIELLEVDTVKLTDVRLQQNEGDGIAITDSATVLGTNLFVFNNTEIGISLNATGAVSLQDSTVSANHTGLVGVSPASFAESGGTWTSNQDGGIILFDVRGNVSLTTSTITDNDDDNNGIGDGLRITSAASLNSIAGTLTLADVTIQDTDAEGAARNQVNGAYVENILGDFSLTASDPTLPNRIEGNSGIGLFVGGGRDASVRDTFARRNGLTGVQLQNFLGLVDVAATRAEEQAGTGIDLQADSNVLVTDVAASGNGAVGVKVAGSGATLTRVTANDNQTGVVVEDADAVTLEDLITNANFDNGTELNNLLSAIVNQHQAEFNQGNGLSATNINDTVIVNGGAFSNNALSGFDMAFVARFDAHAVLLEGNQADGARLAGSDAIRLRDTVANDNFDAGIRIENSGSVEFTDIVSRTNGQGLLVSNAGPLEDTRGLYVQNFDGGALLRAMSGDVSLTGTEFSDNDEDGNGTGDGLQVLDLGDVSAISGNLKLYNVVVDDTDADGSQRQQANGIFVEKITGNLNFTADTPRARTIDDMNGVGAFFASVSDVELSNIIFRSNFSSGLQVTGVTGAATIDDVIAAENAEDGLMLGGSGTFTLSRIEAGGNGRAGLAFSGPGSLNISTLTANNNDQGLILRSPSSVAVTGAVVRGNNGGGISGYDVVGNATFTDVAADGNDADQDGTGDGLALRPNLTANGVGGDFTVSGGSYSGGDAGQQNGVVATGVGGDTLFTADYVASLNQAAGVLLTSFGRVVMGRGTMADNFVVALGAELGADVVVSEAAVVGNGVGVRTTGVAEVTLDGITNEANGVGVLLTDADEATIGAIEFLDNAVGVQLADVTATVLDNVLISGSDDGLVVQDSGAVTVSASGLVDNGFGFRLTNSESLLLNGVALRGNFDAGGMIDTLSRFTYTAPADAEDDVADLDGSMLSIRHGAVQFDVIQFTNIDNMRLNGGAGNDRLNAFLGSGFPRIVTADGGIDTDSVHVQGPDIGETYRLSPTFVRALQKTVQLSGIEDLSVNTGGGNDDILIEGSLTTVNGGTGDDTFTVNASGNGLLLLDGQDGADTYNVNLGPAGGGAIGGSLQIADSGADPLEIDRVSIFGADDDDVFDINASRTIRSGAEQVDYDAGVERVSVVGEGGEDSFDVLPSTTATIFVNGNDPTPPADPGDSLTVDAQGFEALGSDTEILVAGFKPVQYANIETRAIFDHAIPHRNPFNRLDVNGDGEVTPVDALILINELNSAGPHGLPDPPAEPYIPPPYLDVNGDGSILPVDVLIVINHLNSLEGEGEAAGGKAARCWPRWHDAALGELMDEDDFWAGLFA